MPRPAGCRRAVRAFTRSVRPGTREMRPWRWRYVTVIRHCCTTGRAHSIARVRLECPAATRAARRSRLWPHRGRTRFPGGAAGAAGTGLAPAACLSFVLGRAARLGSAAPWPHDAVVVASMGDASVNHSTAAGALNTAAWLAYSGIDLPLLLVCEDNGWGISTPTPDGWV